jgi:hypothetical protein
MGELFESLNESMSLMRIRAWGFVVFIQTRTRAAESLSLLIWPIG